MKQVSLFLLAIGFCFSANTQTINCNALKNVVAIAKAGWKPYVVANANDEGGAKVTFKTPIPGYNPEYRYGTHFITIKLSNTSSSFNALKQEIRSCLSNYEPSNENELTLSYSEKDQFGIVMMKSGSDIEIFVYSYANKELSTIARPKQGVDPAIADAWSKKDVAPAKDSPAPGMGDHDNDGVLDKDDVCPDAKGPKSNKGCPEENATPANNANGIDKSTDPSQTKPSTDLSTTSNNTIATPPPASNSISSIANNSDSLKVIRTMIEKFIAASPTNFTGIENNFDFPGFQEREKAFLPKAQEHMIIARKYYETPAKAYQDLVNMKSLFNTVFGNRAVYSTAKGDHIFTISNLNATDKSLSYALSAEISWVHGGAKYLVFSLQRKLSGVASSTTSPSTTTASNETAKAEKDLADIKRASEAINRQWNSIDAELSDIYKMSKTFFADVEKHGKRIAKVGNRDDNIISGCKKVKKMLQTLLDDFGTYLDGSNQSKIKSKMEEMDELIFEVE